MFLTGSTELKISEIVDVALSDLTVAGIITALVVCLGVVTAAGIVAYKWRGNAGGALMAFIMGLAGAIVGPTLSSIVFTITGAVKLTYMESTAAVIGGYLLYGVICAGLDFGVRYYMIYYMDKTGIGRYKGLSIACGFAAGSAVRYLSNTFYTTLYAFAIKSGSFVPDDIKQQLLTAESEGKLEELKDTLTSYNNAVLFQNTLVQSPKGTYFMYAAQFIAIALLHVALTMYMTRKWLEDEKLKGSLVIVGATLVFELARNLVTGLFGAKLINEATEYYLLAAIFAVTAALSVGFLARIMQNFPQGREKFIKTMRQRAEEQEKKQTRSAWNQVNAYNSTVNDEGAPSEETVEGEVLSFKEENTEQESLENTAATESPAGTENIADVVDGEKTSENADETKA